MTPDTFLFNAGWLFFAAWIAVLVALTVVAFGRDLLPQKAHLNSAQLDSAHRNSAHLNSVQPMRPTRTPAPRAR